MHIFVHNGINWNPLRFGWMLSYLNGFQFIPIYFILGLYAYFRPQWNKLESIEIWVDAAKQIIFSLGPACGCVITLSSYNQFNRDCQKDAVVIAIANGLTSLFSGCVVFAILGYMAHEANKPVFEVVKVRSYYTTRNIQ